MGEEAGLTGSGDGGSPEEIRARIEQTRAEMSETVNVLKERLSPDHLRRQMMEKLHSATVGRARKMMETSTEKAREVGCTVAEKVRKNPVTRTILENPIPAVLVGIGIASVIWWKRAKSGGRAEASAEAGPCAPADGGGEREAPEEAIGTAQSKAQEIVSQVKEQGEAAFGQAREKAGQVFERAREKAGELGTATREKARVLKERSRGLLQERPFLMAAAALGAGLVIGLTLPATEGERRWAAKLKDRLLRGTKDMAAKTYGQAAEVAGDRPWTPGGQGSDLNL